MASVSATSSLGNTALRGFGGLGTGLDRDALIEQMTMGTQNKIDNQKKEMTKAEWKQEAYQSVSDKILDLQDNYFSYTGTVNLKNSAYFGKNQISVLGNPDYTKYVTATGTSSLLDQVSILGVKQMATASTVVSSKTAADIKTNSINLRGQMQESLLQGKTLTFGISDGNGGITNKVDFKLPSSYETYENGKTVTHKIDYTTDNMEDLVNHLNAALKASSQTINNGVKLSEAVEFKYEDGKMKIKQQSGVAGSVVLDKSSDALEGFGYGSGTISSSALTLDEYNSNTGDFLKSYAKNKDTLDYFVGKELTFNYNGQEKKIALVADGAERDAIKGATDPGAEMLSRLQGRLDAAYGTGKVTVAWSDSGELKISANDTSTVKVNSDDAQLMKNLGLTNGASNRINMSDTLSQDSLGLDVDDYVGDNGSLKLKINGKEITGLTANSTINDIIDKINNTEGVGVKATYVDSAGQFVLVSTETGSGRDIDLGDESEGNLAWMLFGGGRNQGNGYNSEDGQDAIISVSYGNGVNFDINRSSNTFDLDGLKVTVSGTFGDYSSGMINPNGGTRISFSGKADIDGVTENVKKFIEEYNAMVTEINNQLTTRGDRSYGPLTEAQKEEMSEKEIEKWEEQAKKGMLYNDSAIRNLSMDIQSVLTSFAAANGVSIQELKDMGISPSDDYKDGGTIAFDESKFRSAMEKDPERVGKIFAGGSGVSKGLMETIESTLTPYATRYASKNGNSYGRLIEEAGSEKIPLSTTNNLIYRELQQMKKDIETLRSQLKSEQDRYITKFAGVETLISKMNAQASWLNSAQ